MSQDKERSKGDDVFNDTSDIARQPKQDESEKNHKLSYVYGLLAAVTLGAANVLVAEIASLGQLAVLCEVYGILVPYLLYHSYCYCKWRADGAKNDSFFCKANSMYFVACESDQSHDNIDNEVAQHDGGSQHPSNDIVQVHPIPCDSVEEKIKEDNAPTTQIQYKLDYRRVLATFSRGVINLILQVTIIQTFTYAVQTGVNPGIIATIFATNLLFIMVYFYFVYGQKLTWIDLGGTVFIVACIALVSIGGATDDNKDKASVSDELKEKQSFNLMMAIIFATIVGLSLAVNSVSIQECIRVGCNIDQANYDGMFIFFLGVLPAYLVYVTREDSVITWRAVAFGSSSFLCVTAGVVFLSKGLECGHAGPVQAIYSQSTTIQAIITAIMTKTLPTGMQIGGVVCGTLGVIAIMCQKKDGESKDQKDDETQEVKIQES